MLSNFPKAGMRGGAPDPNPEPCSQPVCCRPKRRTLVSVYIRYSLSLLRLWVRMSQGGRVKPWEGWGTPEKNSKRVWTEEGKGAQVDPPHHLSADHSAGEPTALKKAAVRGPCPCNHTLPPACVASGCARCFPPSLPIWSSDNMPALSPGSQRGRGTYSRELPGEGRQANHRSQEDAGGGAGSTSAGPWGLSHPTLAGPRRDLGWV